jgi:hypothetical protein
MVFRLNLKFGFHLEKKGISVSAYSSKINRRCPVEQAPQFVLLRFFKEEKCRRSMRAGGSMSSSFPASWFFSKYFSGLGFGTKECFRSKPAEKLQGNERIGCGTRE